jgi:hypothetical protein
MPSTYPVAASGVNGTIRWHDSASMPPHKNDEGAARVPHKVTTSMLPPHEEKISLLSELV